MVVGLLWREPAKQRVSQRSAQAMHKGVVFVWISHQQNQAVSSLLVHILHMQDKVTAEKAMKPVTMKAD